MDSSLQMLNLYCEDDDHTITGIFLLLLTFHQMQTQKCTE